MKTLTKEEKPIVGKLLNEVRNAVTAAIEERAEKFRAQKESDALANIDIIERLLEQRRRQMI